MLEKRSRTWLVAVALLMGCGSGADSIAQRNVPGHVPPDSGIGVTDGGGELPSSWVVHVEVVGVSFWSGKRRVLTSNPDGTPWMLAETDESGRVDVEVPHLGSVSVFSDEYVQPWDTDPFIRRIHSFARVGEETTFRVAAYEATPIAAYQISSVTFAPDDSIPPGTAKIRIELPCTEAVESSGDPTAPIVLELVQTCPGANEWYALALALDASGKPIAASALEHLPLAGSAKTHSVSFSNAKPLVDLTAEVQPVPADAVSVILELQGAVPGNYGVKSILVQNALLSPPFAPATFPMISDFFSQLSISAIASFPGSGEILFRKTRRTLRTSDVPSSFTFDPHAFALPLTASITELTATARPRVTWTMDPAGTLGKCVQADVVFSNSPGAIVWSVRQNAEASGVLELPVLPAVLSEHMVAGEHELFQARVVNLSTDPACSDFVTLPVESYEAFAQL